MTVIILTGASGAGKTTIARQIAKETSDVVCLYFDSIGVPSPTRTRESADDEWAKYLRDEALKSKVKIIDTSGQSISEAVREIKSLFKPAGSRN